MKPDAEPFAAVARGYASCRPHYPDALFAYLSGVCRQHQLAWDCAAGTGQATLPLTRAFRSVVATDISKAMLAQAKPHPSVRYWVAAAGSCGLRTGSTDLVTVAQALHWLQLEDFYAEADRVLVRGGVLAVWTYGTQRVGNASVDGILQRYYHETVGPYWAPERRHVETGYRTLRFPFPELESPVFAMEQEWTLSQLLGYIGTWSATEALRRATGRDPVSELTDQLAPVWGNPADTHRIRWPLSIRVGRRP